jgi:lipoprotein-releasing system permease protein
MGGICDTGLYLCLIISFNIIGSLSMLVIEKRQDISILMAMGADRDLIQRIYILEGVLSACIGAAVGIVLATILCVAQNQVSVSQAGWW